MNILGIETSSVVASVAISNDDGLLGEITINHPKKHSQKLMPIIKVLFSNLGMTIDDIDLISVANGPGSFTGIRIGLTTAKALAHKNETPIVTVPTLDSLAMNVSNFNGKIISIVDARRKRIFVGEYKIENKKLIKLRDAIMTTIDDYLLELNSTSDNLIIIGSGVSENIDYILENKSDNIAIAPIKDNLPTAKNLCDIASRVSSADYKRYDNVEANYIRVSQAEMSINKKG